MVQDCVKLETMQVEAILAEARPARLRENGHIHLYLSIAPDEGFYGWGEWFNAFRRQQGKIRLQIRNAISQLQGYRGTSINKYLTLQI